ncbi:MAG: double-strand break repair protein AddB [Candidatus Puniceispirillaceae bacterium]
MSPPSVYSIDAGLPFAEQVARGLMALADTPEQLARALVLVPSRRSGQALQAAFLSVSDGQAMLLPRMVPIGDIGDEINQGDPIGALLDDAAPDLPPAISAMRRQLLLAKLLRHFRLGDHYPTHPQAMLLANSLAQLLDQLYNADASAAALRDLLPDDFSAHWQDILALLTILIERWPAILASEGAMDAVDRRNSFIRWQAQHWQQTQPDNFIVVAGSTGSIKATRDLIAVVATLPNGYVVLPGLDRGAGDLWADMAADSSHPQHALAELLDALSLRPDQVQDWPCLPVASPTQQARRQFMREIFRPAAVTAAWQRLGDGAELPGRAALDNLKILTARDRREEACLIALCLREVLETPEKTAALITPDRPLAELVIAELQRWDITIEDSAGRPLASTPTGKFLQLLANAVADDLAPLSLLALLKHAYAAGGIKRHDFQTKLTSLELALLRGARPAIPGIDGLIAAAPTDALRNFVKQHIAVPLHPLCAAWRAANPTLASLVAGLAETAELLAADETNAASGQPDRGQGALRLWDGVDGQAAARLLADIEIDGRDFEIAADDLPQILQQIFETETVHPHGSPHPRLAILGAVEARMQSADRIIIAGFNEGNWPPRPTADPWMNTMMRQAVGLPPHNWRTSLSAHDVYMALCADEVVVTRAAKENNTVTIKSRWLQRMEVVLDALGLAGEVDVGHEQHAWIDRLHPKTKYIQIGRPRPCPPNSARPRRFSATEIDLWVTDPYAIYAKKILNLKPLDPIDRPPDAALRGNLVHAALAQFAKTYPTATLPDDALAQLLNFGKAAFGPHMQQPSVKYFWWPRFEIIAAWMTEEEARRRQDGLIEIYAEINGSVDLAGPSGSVRVTARADRVERCADQRLRIIDYKTGVVPSATMVENGARNQLSVEALIASEGGFDQVPAGAVSQIEYWQISGGRAQPGTIKPMHTNGFDSAKMRDSLERLVAAYDDMSTCYLSEPVPSLVPPFRPYKHLARCREWQIEADDD